MQNPLGKCVILGRMSKVVGEVMNYRMCGKAESMDEWEEMLSSVMSPIRKEKNFDIFSLRHVGKLDYW